MCPLSLVSCFVSARGFNFDTPPLGGGPASPCAEPGGARRTVQHPFFCPRPGCRARVSAEPTIPRVCERGGGAGRGLQPERSSCPELIFKATMESNGWTLHKGTRWTDRELADLVLCAGFRKASPGKAAAACVVVPRCECDKHSYISCSCTLPGGRVFTQHFCVMCDNILALTRTDERTRTNSNKFDRENVLTNFSFDFESNVHSLHFPSTWRRSEKALTQLRLPQNPVMLSFKFHRVSCDPI